MKYAYDNRMKAPCNAPIWGLAYDINNETEHRNYSCKPVLGEIRGRSFHKYKKGTTECQLAGVSIWARQYADTYEEAVELYNIRMNGSSISIESIKSQKLGIGQVPKITLRNLEDGFRIIQTMEHGNSSLVL